MLIDTHTHVNLDPLVKNADRIIGDCLRQEIWMVNVGTDLNSSKSAIELAEKYEDGVYASVGVHPNELGTHGTIESRPTERSQSFGQALKKLAQSSSKVVAIGETGLDYYRLDTENTEVSIEFQKKAFAESIKLAKELDLALIVHLRSSVEKPNEAYDDALEILKSEKAGRGVIHCYGSDLEHAQRFIELGFNIGITGIITFKNASLLQEVVRKAPLQNLVIETDAPYLAPEPHRGTTNTPEFVSFVAAKVAQLRGITPERAAEETTANARRMFVI